MTTLLLAPRRPPIPAHVPLHLPLLLLLLSGACDRGDGSALARRDSTALPAARAAERPPVTPARPPGPPRAASALHVLGAPAPARTALEPLDAPLRVELFDRRGRPAAGTRVEWRVLRGGGTVSPAVGTSDGAGVATATWVPGPSADPQVVQVSVRGVGAVELRTTVSVASVTVRPATITLWPGDSVALRADLSDAAGHALAGGVARWESADSTTARVTTGGVVVGVRAGTTRVEASVGKASGASTVTVLPSVAGRVFSVAGEPVSRARVVARSARRTDSAVVAAGGGFAIRLPSPPDDSMDVAVVPADPSLRGARLRIGSSRELSDLRLVLLPASWTITGGTFAGRTVATSPSAAIARAGDGTRFWRLERAERRATWVAAGWGSGHFPIPVAFRRAPGGRAIGPTDSAAFWKIARALERDLDTPLFSPATDSGGEELRGAVHVVVDPALPEPGYTLTTWDGSGTIGDATVVVRSAASLADARIVTHELMHALGFGHTSSWPSVMAPSGGGTGVVMADDVAHAQLLLRLRRAQAATGAPYAIVEAAAAERGGVSTPTAAERRDAGRIP